MNQPAEVWIKQPRDIPAHIKYAHRNGRGLFTFEQIDELVKAINSDYVARANGMTYLSQHQARAEMNRIFGYGNWSSHVDDVYLINQEQRPGTGKNAGKMYWFVTYRARTTVTIRDLWGMEVTSYSEYHAEENTPQPQFGEAHALALTSVESYALRRALINLGDRFGLGLYNGGSLAAHGQYTIQQYPGQLFDWANPNAPETLPAAPPVAVITHETIQAEPVISDNGVDPNWVDPSQQQAAPQQQHEQQQGREAQQFQQEMRDETKGGYAPTPQGNGTVETFGDAREQQQAARDAARQQPQQQMQQQPGGGGMGGQPPQQQFVPQQQFTPDPNMLARVQQGFKQPTEGMQ